MYAVPADEKVDARTWSGSRATATVGFAWWMRSQASRSLGGASGVEQDHLSARLRDEGRDLGPPLEPFLPVRMGLPPEPEPGRDVADLHRHADAFSIASSTL